MKQIDYIKRMKIIRPFARFNYDLRRPLSPGQKSAITRVFKQVFRYRDKRFVRINRKRGESIKSYRSRLQSVKRVFGQGDAYYNGVFTDLPKKASVRLVRGILKVYTKNFVESYVPADYDLLVESPEDEVNRVESDFNFSEISINYSGFKRSFSYENTPAILYDDDPVTGFLGRLMAMSEQYMDVIGYAISGYILRTYY